MTNQCNDPYVFIKHSQKEDDHFFFEDSDQPIPFLHLSHRHSEAGSDILQKFMENNGNYQSNIQQAEGNNVNKKQRKKIAGIRSRQRKKKQLDELEENVKFLTSQIQLVECEIVKTNDLLNRAENRSENIQSEYSSIYSQLQKISSEEEVDEDKINHLLNMLKIRLGAKSVERQAKIEFMFKQILNIMFPALHRYMMYSATLEFDMFKKYQTADIANQIKDTDYWTRELYNEVNFNEFHLKHISTIRQYLLRQRGKTSNNIQTLNTFKKKLKQQEESIEIIVEQFKNILNPAQMAILTCFGEKHKFKRQISFHQPFNLTYQPRLIKKQKLSQSLP